jgi:hypothetical protein
MWNRLKQADIEQWKRQLDLRRDETLRKHAEEMQRLAADQAAIESLSDMAKAFAGKFRKLHASPDPGTTPREAPSLPAAINGSAITAPPMAVKSPITVKPATTIKPNEHRVPHRLGADRPAAKGRHPDRRGHRTNFETYVRAMVKNERGW